jgi:triosephosphate isomerase
MTHSTLVIGNWKLNPNTLAEALALTQSVTKLVKASDTSVAIAPPFIYLTEISKKLARSNIKLAAQTVSTEPMGAFTGEISAIQLRDLKTEYVIIGHSERRAMGETDTMVQKKIIEAIKHKVTPVICIGEKDRDSQGAFYSFVENQLRSIAQVLNSTQIKKVVIAYEPIWAIGTGKTATPADVKEMQLFLLSVLTKLYDKPTAKKVVLLYGGSVKPDNAVSLHVEGGMNGFLVGGASLKAEDFLKIVKATDTK